MVQLLEMWALVEVLGLMCLPLTITVFHNLPDRGWAFSKAIGVALLAFFVWLPLMYLHALPFSQLFIAGVLLILLALNVTGFLWVRSSIIKYIRANISYIVVTEAVFLGMVFLLGWIRSYGPDITGFEMYMDQGILAGIMRSPHFPPSDIWLAGYQINYYYYAHYTIAVMAKLLGQPSYVAFNTGICTFFGLTASCLFGVTCNIVSWARYLRSRAHLAHDLAPDRPDTVYPSLMGAIPYGLLTIAMALLLGNLAATQSWFQAHGDLDPLWWFDPSRVIDKTINEFPAFSFLLSCFHAHVLALAFTILAIGLALNLFMEHDGRGLRVFGRGWRLLFTMGITALIIGGLFTMNGWDYPTYLALALVCIVLQQWMAYGSRLRLELILDVFTVCAVLTALSFFLYAPFYLNFISPSQGIGIVGASDRSPLITFSSSGIGGEVLIYGSFAFVFLSFLVFCLLKQRSLTHSTSEDDASEDTVNEDAASDKPTRRLPGWLNVKVVGVLVIGLVGIATLAVMKNGTTFVVAGSIAAVGGLLVLYHLHDRSRAFTLLLGSVAFALIAMCEVVFLKDVFAGSFPRMNTVFKFYFQSWALLSISCGAGVYFVLEGFIPDAITSLVRSGKQRVQIWWRLGGQTFWATALLLFLMAGAVYPIAATGERTNHFAQRSNSLDGLAYMQVSSPGDYAAITWLNSHIQGNPVIVEALGPDYSDYARISSFTGLPTIMGWVGHEYQWRVNWLNRDLNNADFNQRVGDGNKICGTTDTGCGDIDKIYTDPNPSVVLDLLARYQAQYLYVGPLEHETYIKADLNRFGNFMQIVYSAQGVTIYKVE